LDGQANVTITGNTTLAGLTDGSHRITLYAIDAMAADMEDEYGHMVGHSYAEGASSDRSILQTVAPMFSDCSQHQSEKEGVAGVSGDISTEAPIQPRLQALSPGLLPF